MKQLSKITNENTKQVEIGYVQNEAFYLERGFTEQEVEQAYNGAWYIKGYAPEKPVKQKQAEVRSVRNDYLKQYVDDRAKSPFMWEEVPEEEKALIGEYRKYLRNYPETEGWYEHNPLTFEEWKTQNETKDEIEGGE